MHTHVSISAHLDSTCNAVLDFGNLKPARVDLMFKARSLQMRIFSSAQEGFWQLLVSTENSLQFSKIRHPKLKRYNTLTASLISCVS